MTEVWNCYYPWEFGFSCALYRRLAFEVLELLKCFILVFRKVVFNFFESTSGLERDPWSPVYIFFCSVVKIA